jgi:hypothetical protein
MFNILTNHMSQLLRLFIYTITMVERSFVRSFPHSWLIIVFVNKNSTTVVDKRKRTKGQTISYKTLHKKLKTDQHEPHKIQWCEYRCPGRGFWLPPLLPQTYLRLIYKDIKTVSNPKTDTELSAVCSIDWNESISYHIK